MCERVTVPVSLLNHTWFTERWSSQSFTYHRHIFFVGFSHKDKPKYPWWTKSFCGRLCCCLIAFVSRVQMSRVIVLVWGFIWCWLRAVIFFIPQQRRLFSCLAIFRLLRWQILTVIYLHVLFSELGVALRDLSWGSPACWNSKVFPPVGFQQTWCFGTHEILKKLFVISR